MASLYLIEICHYFCANSAQVWPYQHHSNVILFNFYFKPYKQKTCYCNIVDVVQAKNMFRNHTSKKHVVAISSASCGLETFHHRRHHDLRNMRLFACHWCFDIVGCTGMGSTGHVTPNSWSIKAVASLVIQPAAPLRSPLRSCIV